MSRAMGSGARWLGAVTGVALALVAPALALAHPLGNFSINHYTALRTEAESVLVRYVVDLAEIPTFQEVQDHGLVPETGHPSAGPYLAREADALKEGLRLEAEGRRLELRVESSEIAFTPGAGALPTMRMGILYRARLYGTGDTVRLTYQDGNHPGRAGWREIVAAAGPSTAIAETTAPAADLSRGLMDYPADLLQRPPQDVSARIVFTREIGVAKASTPAPRVPERVATDNPGERRTIAAVAPPARRRGAIPEPSPRAELTPAAPLQDGAESTVATDAPVGTAGAQAGPVAADDDSAAAAPPRPGAPPTALTELVTTSGLGIGIAMSALAIAMGLGALHALEPGHGKTMVAAYLVGSRGTARHAVILGLIVTASHTAGVYLLGAATLYASRYVVPDRLYPWLAAGSGLAIATLGAVLFLRRLARRHPGRHHAHGHDHNHGSDDGRGPRPDHDHDHAHDHAHAHDDGSHASHPHPHGHGHGFGDHQHHHHHHHAVPANVSLGQLFTLGVSGGIVPCPAALVVLLSAISLRRVGFGLLLVAAFSAGLAAVLVAIGILMVHARRLMARFTGDGPLLQRWLPLASSAAVAIFGVAIAVQAVVR